MNKRLVYGSLNIIIRLLLHVLNKTAPSKELCENAEVIAEECDAVADGRMNE